MIRRGRLSETKRCSKCGVEKPLSEFHRDKTHKDGYHNQCKECKKKYRAANRERLNARAKEFYAANREQQKVYSKKRYAVNRERYREYRLKRNYGLSIEDYNALFEAQAGCCAICGCHQSELKKKLAVDHDHVTGEVRGLLCVACNAAIGLLCDDPELLEKGKVYLYANATAEK